MTARPDARNSSILRWRESTQKRKCTPDIYHQAITSSSPRLDPLPTTRQHLPVRGPKVRHALVDIDREEYADAWRPRRGINDRRRRIHFVRSIIRLLINPRSIILPLVAFVAPVTAISIFITLVPTLIVSILTIVIIGKRRAYGQAAKQ